MKICFAVLHHDTICRDPATYLDEVPVHRHLPRAVAARGHQVSVVHLFPSSARLQEGGVDYHFVAEAPVAQWVAGQLGRRLRHAPALYEPAIRTLRRIRVLEPDIVHVHGTSLHLNLALLRLISGRCGPPVVLHYHGGYPASRVLVRVVQRFGFGGIRRFLFTTRAHAAPFVDAGLIRDAAGVVPFMEMSSPFRLRPRIECRRATGMTGDPIFLWTGRLHPIKDPLTALQGFERLAAVWPDARLYLYYRTAELLPALQAFVAARPVLQARVHFRGKAPFHEMETIYNSADFLLQASRREFSGCAVLEAMACGVVPVVTDIPSFRAMTDHGRYGILFPPGDAEALANGVQAVRLERLPERAAAVQEWFRRALSFDHLAHRLDAVYREVLAERAGERALSCEGWRSNI